MAKFQMNVVLNTDELITARVSDSTAGVTASWLDKVDAGKFVKMTADSQYGLCAVGDQIEGLLATANDVAPNDGFAMGAIQTEGRARVMLDGLQATPGTGSIAVGDFVVAGTVVARGTALTSAAPAKVCKATPLSVATTPAVNFPAGSNLAFKWRVVALLGGVGTVGALAIIEQVG